MDIHTPPSSTLLLKCTVQYNIILRTLLAWMDPGKFEKPGGRTPSTAFSSLQSPEVLTVHRICAIRLQSLKSKNPAAVRKVLGFPIIIVIITTTQYSTV